MKDKRLFVKMECEYGPKHMDIYAGECCGKVEFRSAMTAYHYDGPKNSIDDPNRPIVMCNAHHDEYVAHWQDMWSNVERG